VPGFLTLAVIVAGLAVGQETKPQGAQHARRNLRNLIERADTNADGKISRDEWTRSSQSFDRLDQNHDGFISRDEIEVVRRNKDERRRERRENVFRRLDKNQDGHIDRDEWKRSPGAFERLDRNHDGVITLDEMVSRGHRRRDESAPNDAPKGRPGP
jgi:Ca2+-binding EF-hand superfamily protein